MLLDQNLVFSDSQAGTFTATGTASTNVIDLSGGANFSFGPNAATFGEDLGAGFGAAAPEIVVVTGAVAPATTNSATLNIQFQGSTDSVTWTTYIETGAIPATAITANSRIAAFDWPQKQVASALPRFVRLNYAIPAATSFSGNTNSTITAFVTLADDNGGQLVNRYPSGFSVGV